MTTKPSTSGGYDCPACGETVYNDAANQVREVATKLLHCCPPPAPAGAPAGAPRSVTPIGLAACSLLAFLVGCAIDYGPLMLVPVAAAIVAGVFLDRQWRETELA